jgi:hypothetical protein
MSGYWDFSRPFSFSTRLGLLGGGRAAVPAFQQILDLAAADGWAAVYDPSNPATVTTTSGRISALADGLGNLATLVQGTAANRPLLSVGAFGGLSALIGDGSDALSVDLTDTPQPYSILAVAKYTSGSGHVCRVWFDGTGLSVSGGNWTAAFGTGLGGPAADTDPHVVGTIANGGSSQIRVDGSATSGAAGAGALQRIDMMGEAGGSAAWNGLCGPLLIRLDADAAAIGRMEALLGSFF